MLQGISGLVTVALAAASHPPSLPVDSGASALRRCAPRWRRRSIAGSTRREVVSCAFDDAPPFWAPRLAARAKPVPPPASSWPRSGDSPFETGPRHPPTGIARVPHAGGMGAACGHLD